MINFIESNLIYLIYRISENNTIGYNVMDINLLTKAVNKLNKKVYSKSILIK